MLNRRGFVSLSLATCMSLLASPFAFLKGKSPGWTSALVDNTKPFCPWNSFVYDEISNEQIEMPPIESVEFDGDRILLRTGTKTFERVVDIVTGSLRNEHGDYLDVKPVDEKFAAGDSLRLTWKLTYPSMKVDPLAATLINGDSFHVIGDKWTRVSQDGIILDSGDVVSG